MKLGVAGRARAIAVALLAPVLDLAVERAAAARAARATALVLLALCAACCRDPSCSSKPPAPNDDDPAFV